ncbi:MAG TPA: hypothetical protein VLD62_02470 [Acidimicrobiia bacterium]|nr:hypothetical protein [Acidimicrobiia bacterium]
MRPGPHHTLDAVVATFEEYVMPEVADEYVRSLGLTIGQMLRSVRERILHEPEALHEDNADLRDVLVGVLPVLGPETAATVRRALDESVIPDGVFPSLERLMAEADALRGALVAMIEATADPEHPARSAGRDYLRRQLERQEPWLVDAWTGPRR